VEDLAAKFGRDVAIPDVLDCAQQGKLEVVNSAGLKDVGREYGRTMGTQVMTAEIRLAQGRGPAHRTINGAVSA
jgi:hypothetical protein